MDGHNLAKVQTAETVWAKVRLPGVARSARLPLSMSLTALTLVLAAALQPERTVITTSEKAVLLVGDKAQDLSAPKGAFPVAWSYDGAWLLLARPAGSGAWSSWAVEPLAAESELVVLSERGSLPSLSPDGRKALVADAAKGVVVITLDREAPKLTALLPAGAAPAWSPDGSRIAFAGSAGQRGAFLVADGPGAKARPLARDVLVTALAWSPDGRTVALVARGKATGDKRKVVLAWPGRSETRTFAETDFDGVSWAPNGLHLLVRQGGVWGRMDAANGEWGSVNLKGPVIPQWLSARELLGVEEGRAVTVSLRGAEPTLAPAAEQAHIPAGSGEVRAALRLTGIVVAGGSVSPFARAPRPRAGSIRLQGTIVSLDLVDDRFELDVTGVLSANGQEFNPVKPVRQAVSWRDDTRRLTAAGGRPLRASDLTLDAEVAVLARGTGTRADAPLEADGVFIGVPAALETRVEPATRGPRTLDYDGVSMDPVTVPLVFPMVGRTSWSDTFLAPRGGGTRRHHGQDLMAPKMRPMVAAFDGVVSFGGTPSSYSLSIRSDDGWMAVYIHVNNDTPGTDDMAGGERYAFAPGLRPGDRVVAGQLVAFNGDSGNAEGTAPHLHFELHDLIGGGKLNPARSLRAATKVEAPYYPAPARDLRPASNEVRWDGVVTSVDRERGVVIMDSIGEVGPTGAAKATVSPRTVYVRLAADARLSLRTDMERSVTLDQLREGLYVSAVGRRPEPGAALNASRIAVGISMTD